MHVPPTFTDLSKGQSFIYVAHTHTPILTRTHTHTHTHAHMHTHTHAHTHTHTRVVEYGHVNKMQATNLAIVFGPTIMRPEQDTIEMATLMPVQNGIAEVMITEFNSIFRK